MKEPAVKYLRHVVALKFKETTRPEQMARIEAAFRELRTRIPSVAGFEWGLNNSPEGFDKGFTHGFILTFHSESDRDSYLRHPAHKNFVETALPLVGDVFVMDFWAEE